MHRVVKIQIIPIRCHRSSIIAEWLLMHCAHIETLRFSLFWGGLVHHHSFCYTPTLDNCIMIGSFTLFALCAFVVATWVPSLSVTALHLESRGPTWYTVCNGLARMRRTKGNRLCTNKNNAFSYAPGSLTTLVMEPASGGPGNICGNQ